MEISAWEETQFYADVTSKIKEVESKYASSPLRTCQCVYSSTSKYMRIAISNRGHIFYVTFLPNSEVVISDLSSPSYLGHDTFVIVVDSRFGKLVAEAIHKEGYSESVLPT